LEAQVQTNNDNGLTSRRLTVQAKATLVILLVAVVVLAVCRSFLDGLVPFSDEKDHYSQIVDLARGIYPQKTTVFPGYHLVIAALVRLSGKISVNLVRTWTVLISILSILVFHALNRTIRGDEKESASLGTLQYIFFPLLFPFFCLIYTDVLSLLIVMLSLLASMKRREHLAGTIGILATIIRQSNIVWLAFVFVLLLFRILESKKGPDAFKDLVKRGWVCLLGFALFLLFVVLNRGVAMGDKLAHPFPQFHLSNVYFMLFLFFFLFLPLNMANFRLLFSRRWAVIGVLFLFPIFLGTFSITHPYNSINYVYYLRNRVLFFFTGSPLLTILFYVPVAYSILSLSVTPLREKEFLLLYPFSVLSLVPLWLVEQRYYFIPLVFFSLFRRRSSNLVEYATLAIYLVASACLFSGMVRHSFFP